MYGMLFFQEDSAFGLHDAGVNDDLEPGLEVQGVLSVPPRLMERRLARVVEVTNCVTRKMRKCSHV